MMVSVVATQSTLSTLTTLLSSISSANKLNSQRTINAAINARRAYGSVTVTHFLVFIIVCLQLVAAVDEQNLHYGYQLEPQRQQQHQNQQQKQKEKHQQLTSLDAQNFLVGIARIGAKFEGASQCGHELEILLEAIASKQLWGLKVVDSFGAAPQSFYWGNYFWFSSQDFCDDLNTPYRISFSGAQARTQMPTDAFNVTSPFPLEFTLIYFDFKSPYYIDLKLPFEYFLHVGLCLPRSCDADSIFNYTTLYFRTGSFDMQRNFQLTLQPLDMRRPRFSWRFFNQTGSVIYVSVCFTVILLVIIAETIDKSRVRLEAQKHKLTKSQDQIVHIGPVKKEKTSLLERILICFRLSENYKRAITLESRVQPSKSFLSAIAGLRTIVCLWITVFHVYYYSLYAMSNAPLIFAKLEHFALQPIMQACFYVDVFFVMSAFLLVYNFLQNESQRKQIHQNGFRSNMKLFGKTVLHRYLRLTPVMVITMLLSDMVFDFLNMYSPFRLGENSGIYCKRNWWYNLLYIHNLLDMRKICCSWTWYLACEMQYFILFTGLLYGYAKHPKVTKAAFIALAFGLVVISWLCNYQNRITFQIDVIHSTLNELYVKPWVRINPYIGGAITGWLLHQLQQKQKQQQQQQHHQQQQQRQHRHNQQEEPQQRQQNLNLNQNHHHHHHHHYHQEYCINNISTYSKSNDINSNSNRISISISVSCLVQRIWPIFFWFSCFVLYVATNFMSYWRSTPAWLVAAIMSFGKLLFAFFIGGVIVLCALGRGGVLQRLLSMRFLQFLNRFCFSIYMLAPVIVVAVFGLRRQATNFTEVGSGMDFLAVIVLSIASAFLLVLLVEMPIQRISSVLLRDSTTTGGHVQMKGKTPNYEQ